MAAHYFSTIENVVTGKPVASASIRVLDGLASEGGAEIDVYSDDGVTLITQPILTDSAGFFEFWTNETSGVLEISYDGEIKKEITDVEFIGGTVNSDVTSLLTRMDDAEADIAKYAVESFIVACSDETTALTTGTAKITFRMPYAFTLTAVRASLSTAQSSGSILTVDINEGGTTILSTKLTIDNTEKTSTTAATAAVISDTALADDAEITVDIDQVGDGTAKGLKIALIGTRT